MKRCWKPLGCTWVRHFRTLDAHGVTFSQENRKREKWQSLNVPSVLTSPRDDAMQLYKALKGFGCDKAAVINILAHRDATQRALIQQEYRTMYSEELNKRLSKELSGDLEKAVLLWMYDPAARDATIVRKDLSGDGVDPRAGTEVICSRTSGGPRILSSGVLDPGILSSGLLLAYVTAMRYEGPEVDRAAVEQDAKALFKAGEKKLGTDEKTFIRIFSERSRAHLAAVSAAYHSVVYGNSLKKAVKSETSGLFEFALLTILQCVDNPTKYFAKELHKAMKGLGTNDTTLIRIIVTRTEIDMQYIKAEYQEKYKKSLNDAVHAETSDDHRTFLLSLLGTAN
ncbi:annexin D5-like [Lycium barbarum]|uniref:annexin D5-like n=1 Tax=Lycium barbarum TaxID=112863 RepID=UPI00293F1F4C|nr:annexin D5-like [Lycium barbarum]